MRERLTQLIHDAHTAIADRDDNRDTYTAIADYLLGNGVIVPPVKVGQTVWAIEKYRGKPIAIIEGKAQMVGVTSRSVKVLLRNHKDFNKTFVFGKTVFLTREAAEAALKARENNA